jgi:hypothetical protein
MNLGSELQAAIPRSQGSFMPFDLAIDMALGLTIFIIAFMLYLVVESYYGDRR